MGLLSTDLTADRTTLPGVGPFAPVRTETREGGEMRRAVLTSMLALYPVIAAVVVALISLTIA